jgi:fucose 4-O-acetylase-like acetyltransferase
MSQNEQRIFWLDNMKGLGILILITVAHTQQYKYVILAERTLLMPLFFFISGFLFKNEKYKNLIELIKKQARHLLIPYLFFALFAFCITSLRFIIKDSALFFNNYTETVYKPLWGILYGSSYSLKAINNGPLWFLTCLFSLQIEFYLITSFIHKRSYQILVILISVIIGYYCKLLPFNNNFFFSINTSLVVMLYFAIGYYVRLELTSLLNSLRSWMLIITIPIQIYLITLLDSPALFAFNQYGNPFITVICTILSLINVVIISKAITTNAFINKAGKNTLFIFGFHYPLLVIIIPGILHLLNINSVFYLKNPDTFNILIHSQLLIASIIFGGLQLMFIYPAIPLLKSGFPKIFK